MPTTPQTARAAGSLYTGLTTSWLPESQHAHNLPCSSLARFFPGHPLAGNHRADHQPADMPLWPFAWTLARLSCHRLISSHDYDLCALQKLRDSGSELRTEPSSEVWKPERPCAAMLLKAGRDGTAASSTSSFSSRLPLQLCCVLTSNFRPEISVMAAPGQYFSILSLVSSGCWNSELQRRAHRPPVPATALQRPCMPERHHRLEFPQSLQRVCKILAVGLQGIGAEMRPWTSCSGYQLCLSL